MALHARQNAWQYAFGHFDCMSHLASPVEVGTRWPGQGVGMLNIDEGGLLIVDQTHAHTPNEVTVET